MGLPKRRPMAWTKIIDEDEADSEPRALYGRPIDPESGRVDETMRVHSLHPAGLAGHASLYYSSMRSTPTLPKVEGR
jgi:hypothetical protein